MIIQPDNTSTLKLPYNMITIHVIIIVIIIILIIILLIINRFLKMHFTSYGSLNAFSSPLHKILH